MVGVFFFDILNHALDKSRHHFVKACGFLWHQCFQGRIRVISIAPDPRFSIEALFPPSKTHNARLIHWWKFLKLREYFRVYKSSSFRARISSLSNLLYFEITASAALVRSPSAVVYAIAVSNIEIGCAWKLVDLTTNLSVGYDTDYLVLLTVDFFDLRVIDFFLLSSSSYLLLSPLRTSASSLSLQP